MTQKDRNHIARINQAVATIEELAPKEMQRENRQRRKALENAYQSLSTHAYGFGLHAPKLNTFYDPQDYLAKARIVKGWIDHLSGGVLLPTNKTS